MSTVRATPVARKLAVLNKVDLAKVIGTGKTNYIKASDVAVSEKTVKITHIARGIMNYHNINPEQLNDKSLDTINKRAVLDFMADGGKRGEADLTGQAAQNSQNPALKKVPMAGMRKVIAQRMVQSLNAAPQYTLFSEIDVSKAQALLAHLNKLEQPLTGMKLTVTDIMIKIIAAAVKKHAIINSSIINDEICFHECVNIGIAVGLDDGLIVPNIKNADEKSLRDISKERKDLVDRARKGKLKPGEYSGGTFTISNLGIYHVDYSTPIINQPESGIIGLGRIKEKVEVVQGKMEIKPIMGISLTLDHRHIDGAEGAKFIAILIELFDNPYGTCLKWY